MVSASCTYFLSVSLVLSSFFSFSQAQNHDVWRPWIHIFGIASCLFLSDTTKRCQVGKPISGWLVTLISGLVPGWVYKLADTFVANPLEKFFSARDRPPQVTVNVPPLSPTVCNQIRAAVRDGVQEGLRPMVNAIDGLTASINALMDMIRGGGLTFTISRATASAGPSPSKNNADLQLQSLRG